MASNALRELIALFEIGVDDHELQEATHKLEGFVGRVRKVGEVVAEVFAVNLLREFFGEQIEGAERLEILSQRTGLATDALQKFQFAAQLVGVDSEQAAHSLGFLNKAVGEALTGGKEQAQDFAKLHIALKDTNGSARPVGEVLNDVADAIAKLPNQQEKAAFAMKLFGREGQVLLPLLQRGREGLQEVGKEFDELGGGMSHEFIQASVKAAESIKKLNLVFVGLKARLTLAALPAIEKMINGFRAGAKRVMEFIDHTKLLEHGLAMLASLAVGKLVLSLIKLAKVFGLLKPSIGETLVSLVKFGIPLLLIGFLILAFEDLWTAVEGGESVIGDVLTEMYGAAGAKEIIDELTGVFGDLRGVWEDLKPLAKEFLQGALEAIPVAIKMVLGLVEVLKLVFDTLHGIAGVLGTTAGRIGDVLGIGGLDPKNLEASNKVKEAKRNAALNAIDQESIKAGGNILNDLGVIGDLLTGKKAPSVPGGPEAGTVSIPEVTIGGGAGAGNTMNQHNEINVTVQGGDNPKATGDAVGASVATKLERSNYSGQLALVRQ